eukprot:Clim_evm8s202 gene=Clim_evmTU8s202
MPAQILTDAFASYIKEADAAGFEERLNAERLDVNAVDSSGTTVLMHCVYSRKPELTDVLLKKGADPNLIPPPARGYSPLMFAAMGGNEECCRLLLEAGADKDHKNDIGKTSTDMAAFVGNSDIASVIIQWVSRKRLVGYLEERGRLSENDATKVYEAITSPIPSPLAMLNTINEAELFHINPKALLSVLHDVVRHCRAELKNDTLAYKAHFLHQVVEKASATKSNGEDSMEEFRSVQLYRLPDKEKDQRPGMDAFIKDATRTYPFGPDSIVLQQLVPALATHKSGTDGSTALQLVVGTLNGPGSQKALADPAKHCDSCLRVASTFKSCSRCKKVNYCSTSCQKLRWPGHKADCKASSS